MATFNFRDAGYKATNLSDLMQNREKIFKEELDGKNLTLADFDWCTMSDGSAFATVVFEEIPEKFYNCGKQGSDLIADFIQAFNGNVEKAREEYRKAEKISIHCEMKKSKATDNYYLMMRVL